MTIPLTYFALGDRLMVGRQALDLLVGVRIPLSQPGIAKLLEPSQVAQPSSTLPQVVQHFLPYRMNSVGKGHKNNEDHTLAFVTTTPGGGVDPVVDVGPTGSEPGGPGSGAHLPGLSLQAEFRPVGTAESR